jgi:amino acid transporter
MIWGCLAVTALYLGVNGVLLSNLSSGNTARATLAHELVVQLAGIRAGEVVSAAMVCIFASTLSALAFAGPRVVAAMAQDGWLPRGLSTTQSLASALEASGAVLSLFTALTALGLFRIRFQRHAPSPPSPLQLTAAGVFSISSLAMLVAGFESLRRFGGWLALATGAAAIAYWRRRPLRSAPKT